MEANVKFGLFCTIVWILWKAFSFGPKAGMIAVLVLVILQIICNLSEKSDAKRKIKIEPIQNIECLKLDNRGVKSSIDFFKYFLIGACVCVILMVIFFGVNPIALGIIPIFIISEYSFTRSGSLKYLDEKDEIKEITFNKPSLQFIVNNKKLDLKNITNVTFNIEEEEKPNIVLLLFSRYNMNNNACVYITFETRTDTTTLKVPNLGAVIRIKQILQAYHIKINYVGYCETETTRKLLGWDDPSIETTNQKAEELESSNEPEVFGNLEKENAQLFVLCPSCGMKYGTEITTDSEIKIRNFEDEDLDEPGQQIHCLKCGQKFTVPDGNY